MANFTLMAHMDGWNSPILPSHGWYQDTDGTITFHVVEGRAIRVRESAAEGATSILVDPIKKSLSMGDFLRFGSQVLTTSAACQVGDTTIPVTATTGVVPRGSILWECFDVTGLALVFQLRNSPGDSTVIKNTNAALATPTEGLVTVPIADSDFDTEVSPGYYYYRLKITSDTIERVVADGSVCIRRNAG